MYQLGQKYIIRLMKSKFFYVKENANTIEDKRKCLGGTRKLRTRMLMSQRESRKQLEACWKNMEKSTCI